MTDLTPTGSDGLADAIGTAYEAGTPLEIRGGGTRLGLGRPVQAERTVSTAGLSGITLYEPGALTLMVQAGTPMAEIENALAAEGQMLPFEPPDHRALLGTDGIPTIGGAVAVGASGPRRLQRGACRDAMIGVGFVDGRGQQISNGGRVMKNVTGVDLVKLMAGSYGTLGVLTNVNFKLLPAPQKTVTLTCSGTTMEHAVQAFSAALGSPFEPTAAAYIGTGKEQQAMLRVEGLEGSVDYRVAGLLDLLANSGDWETIDDSARNAELWRRVRDVEDFAESNDPVWRMSVKPTDGPKIAAILERTLPLDYVVDWAGGLMWIRAQHEALMIQAGNSADPTGGSAADTGLQGIHTLLRSSVAQFGGHVTLIRASAATRAAIDVFQPEDPVIERLSAGLRTKFDPKGILNPGRIR